MRGLAIVAMIVIAGCAGSPAQVAQEEQQAGPSPALPAPSHWTVSCTPEPSADDCVGQLPSMPGGDWRGISVVVRANGDIVVASERNEPGSAAVALFTTVDQGRQWAQTMVPVAEVVAATGLADARDIDTHDPVIWEDRDGVLHLLATARAGDVLQLHALRLDGEWQHVQEIAGSVQADGVVHLANDTFLLARQRFSGSTGQVLHWQDGMWTKRHSIACELPAVLYPSDLSQPSVLGSDAQVACGGKPSMESVAVRRWNASGKGAAPRLDSHGCRTVKAFETAAGLVTIATPPGGNPWTACDPVVTFEGRTLPAADWGDWLYPDRLVEVVGATTDAWGGLHIVATETHYMRSAAGSSTGMLGSQLHLFDFTNEGPSRHAMPVAPVSAEGLSHEGPSACATTLYGQGFFQVCDGGAIRWWFLMPSATGTPDTRSRS